MVRLDGFMRRSPWLIIFVALCFGGLLGCAPRKGPATNIYLRGYVSAVADLNAKLEQLPPVNPPEKPVLPEHATRDQRRQFVVQNRSYRNELIQYFNFFIERGHVLENLYGQTLTRLAALNGAGVDPSAVAMVAIRERTIGQRRELFVEMGRLAELRRDALSRQGSTDALDDLLSSVFVEALKDASGGLQGMEVGALVGAAKGLASIASKGRAEKEAIGEEADQVAVATTQLQRDVIDYQTAYAQLRTTVQANYPDEDWSFMGPKKAGSTKQ